MSLHGWLEQALLQQQLITPEKMNKIKKAVTIDKPLPDVLEEQKVLEQDAILDILSEYCGISWVNLDHYIPEEEAISIMPMSICQRYRMFPLFKIKNTLMVATANPSDVQALDEIRVKTGYGVEPLLALQSAIVRAMHRYYRVDDSMSDMIESVEEMGGHRASLAEERELVEAASDEPIIKLVNLLIVQAVRDRASDVHINPEKKSIRVRYRVDGLLHEIAEPPKKFQAAIASRIKILGNLDIAERRIPQDGRVELKVDNRMVDLRISTFPTIYGENVVIRLLDKSNVLLGLEEIGFSKRDLERFNNLISKPYGILITSGPTGSGKTTTLYAALSTINSEDKNIITLEDPVEYELKGIQQSQVHPKAGFTFATGLRAILRQDPDVILVGEVRDLETASISVQAAMTGHLVLTTLHTNDAPGSVIRLAEMGVQNFLISSTLIGSLAQRLVRVICDSCREEFVTPESAITDLLGAGAADEFAPKEISSIRAALKKTYTGKGCQQCRNSSYLGRTGLYELMEITSAVQDAIIHRVPETEMRKLARREGMHTLREDGIGKVKQGITTIEEVLRVTKLE